MDCVSISNELLCTQKHYSKLKNNYKLDMWREVKRRWFVFGVLLALMMAVLAPRVGASGGPLHTEYLTYAPLWYIYYSAGRRTTLSGAAARAHARLLAVAVAHAHIVAPALCALVVSACWDVGIDHRIVKGALFSSLGGPCSWLVLSLSRSDALAPVTAANYALSLIATPIAVMMFCGRATVPPLGGVLATALVSVVPFALGVVRARRSGPPAPADSGAPAAPACALLLLYAECCTRLRDAEGSLYVADVIATMTIEVCAVCASVCACCAYARCGLVRARRRHLALAAVTKSLDLGWESSTTCTPSGLSRLPAVFLGPAQALLLAAIFGDERDDSDDGDSDDDTRERIAKSVQFETLPQ